MKSSVLFDYVRTHATENDFFISGDCGADYLNPGMLANEHREADIADGWDSWTELNKKYFKKYNLSITGFVIDGHSPGMGEKGLAQYAEFSPDGLVGQKLPGGTLYKETMPITHMHHDLYGSPQQVGETILSLSQSDQTQAARFMIFRTILKSPSWHQKTIEHVQTSPQGKKIRWVDPFTFFLLYKESLKQ